jgi:hypothetical protein
VVKCHLAGTMAKPPSISASLLQAKKGLSSTARSTARFANHTLSRIMRRKTPEAEKQLDPSLSSKDAIDTGHGDCQQEANTTAEAEATMESRTSGSTPLEQQETRPSSATPSQTVDILRRQDLEENPLLAQEVPFCMPTNAASDPDRHIHQGFMEQALDMVSIKLQANSFHFRYTVIPTGSLASVSGHLSSTIPRAGSLLLTLQLVGAPCPSDQRDSRRMRPCTR